jgi:hypothetical protein
MTRTTVETAIQYLRRYFELDASEIAPIMRAEMLRFGYYTRTHQSQAGRSDH